MLHVRTTRVRCRKSTGSNARPLCPADKNRVTVRLLLVHASGELFAIGATFTLLAWAFAYSFIVCQAIEPGSFSAAGGAGGERSWMELLFMSFTICPDPTAP